jgi:hypothetical protein
LTTLYDRLKDAYLKISILPIIGPIARLLLKLLHLGGFRRASVLEAHLSTYSSAIAGIKLAQENAHRRILEMEKRLSILEETQGRHFTNEERH